MNVEENRLQTFRTWPGNAPVEPVQLAREGFFATGNFLETECFCCQKRSDDWQYGDNITARHIQLDPACVFLCNPTNSGNVPLHPRRSVKEQPQQASSNAATDAPQIETPLDLTQLDLKIESNRLATFVNWPNPNITPQSLAKAGFYYLNRSDQVRCAWCKGVIAKWEKEDNAFEEHHRFFPECPRVQLGPLIEIASDGIRDLGIQQITPPKCPKFSSLDARLRTYTKWPIGDIQRPEALAQAGLYYHDVDDQVRCFHCFIGLRSWQKEDDPWFEHAKWYPQCQFVRLVKGANYIQEVQEKTRQISANQTTECRQDLALPAVSIDEAMSTTPVRQALEIGIDVGAIRTVTQRRLALIGRPYDTVENLIKAVFGDSDDENDDNDDYGNSNSDSEAGPLVRIWRQMMSRAHDGEQSGPSTSASVSNVLPAQPNSASPNAHDTDVPPQSGESVEQVSVYSPNNCLTPTTLPETSTSKLTRSTMTSNSEKIDRNISLEEENRKLKDARLCKVCLDEEVGVVFLPCGHLVTCVQCAPIVNQCPMCRTTIKGFVRTFLS